MRASLIILSTALILSACARTETPEQARERAQAAYDAFDEAAADARNNGGEVEEIVAGMSPGQIDTSGSATLTPGSWSITTQDDERMARFGEEGETARVTIACEIGGGIDIRLIGMVPQGGSGTVFISAPEGGSTFTASAGVGDTEEAYISVPAADPFIGRLISSNGPFSLRLGGDQQITFPADDVLTSVVSICDRRTAQAIADAGADDAAAAPTPATPTPTTEEGAQ